jgi:hypothetical protein
MDWIKTTIPVILIALALVFFSACVSHPPDTGSPASSYKTYDNPALGLQLQYPGSWKYYEKTAPDDPNVTSIQFLRNDDGLMALVQVADTAGTATPPRTLDQWAADMEMSLPNVSHRSDYHLVASEMSSLSGTPARRIEYTALMNNGPRMRGVVYLMVRGTKGMTVAVVASDDDNGVLSEGARRFVSSITLK